MKIGTNIHAMQAYSSLNRSNIKLNKINQKLTTGIRINSSGDDPTMLTTAIKLQMEANGFEKARQNSSNAISLLQTADGALNTIHSMAQRMRELSVQAANETNSQDDRLKIQEEITQLNYEIDETARKAEYNGIRVLNGDASSRFVIQIGSDKGNEMDISIAKISSAILGADKVNVTTTEFAVNSIKLLDKMISDISDVRSEVGSFQMRLEYTLSRLDIGRDKISTSLSRLMDTDMAVEMSEYAQHNLIIQASLSVLAQSNQRPSEVVSLLRK